ncbi:hypothetical protein KIW84_040813 [Lathyrus oleraceus]|uniref:Uncharacterized protein n=1 Tax=Pisum sativum TaxID=3888 RepID=A0A9D4X8A5_PEA|nr:hypothetical protein KIW84_040813 [Pisum sativum]
MAPSRKDKGKTQIDEGSSEHQEFAQHAPSLKSRRLTFDFWNRSLMPVKYGNLSSFPSHSFDFSKLLRRQGVYFMVSNCGNYYPDLVKDFYANLVIVLGDKDVLTSRVKNTDIVMDVEVFGNCLGLSYKGQSFLHGFTQEWEGYRKMDYFFHICRVSQQAILVKTTMIKNYHEQKFEMASTKTLLENLSKSQNPTISDEEESEEEDDEDMELSDSD